MSSIERRYYRTRIARWILYPFYIIGIPIGVVATLLPDSRWTFHLWGGACLVGMLWSARRTKNMGVEVADDGYLVHNTLVTKRLKWPEIAEFYTKRWVFNHEVFIRLNSGESVRTSLLQGRVVIWKDGRTRDVLSILRSELASHSVVATQVGQ